MIRKLFDLLPLFGNKAVTPTEKLLQNSLLPFAELDKSLPKKVFQYVMTGAEPEILYTLNQLDADKITVLLDKPGTVDWWYSQNSYSKEVNKVIKQARDARYDFYSMVGNELTNEQVIRFSKVLASACQNKNIKITTEKVPSWMIYLLCDALVTTLKGTFNESQKLTHRTDWSIKLLADLISIEQNNESGDDILFAIFDRNEISEYYNPQLNIFFELPGLQDYIENHAQFVRTTLVEKLSASGLIQFLKYLAEREALRILFSDVIVKLAMDQKKTVRSEAEPMLNILPVSDVTTHLSDLLFNGTPKQRSQAADLFARQGENKDILERALQLEKSKAVIKSIESAIMRFDVVNSVQNIEMPELPELTPLADTPLPESAKDILVENLIEMKEKARINAEKEIADNKLSANKYKWAQGYYNKIKEMSVEHCHDLVDRLNYGNDSKRLSNEDMNIIKYKNRIKNMPEFTFYHAMRIIYGNVHTNFNISTARIENETPAHVIAALELRQVEGVLQKLGCSEPARIAASLCLESYNYGVRLFPKPEQLWPFFSQYPDYIAEALGLLPNKSKNQYSQFELSHAFELLGKLPSIPAQFIPRIMELALGENKTFRVTAQRLLEELPNVHVNVQESLHSTKQEIRITTIEWLARIRNKDSIAPLYALLKKEKRETVRAALLAALEQFGEDISPYLSEKILREEALKGLKTNPPASMSWFDYNTIPPLTWENGKAVDANIIKWWIILAVKLKMPAGNTLLQRYVGLLAKESQHKLGHFILHAFITQDVKNPSLEDAMAEAHKDAPGRLKNYRHYFEKYGEYYQKYGSYTLEMVVEEIKHEVLQRYLGSAISEKGMLALISHIEGHVAVSALRNYTRDHYQRRSQIEAMISALAVSDDPLIIQLLLSLSRRYRTAAIQEKARELVKDIAERNGWSADELADRTIPTAGLDETGTLVLEYGERTFTARMDSKQKLVLLNPEGKELKALPAARKTDNEEQIKEAKKLFSSSKKELKQVIDLQTARLYESMCAQRQWPSEDWQTYIMIHPIMRPLIERLVWQEVKDGQVLNTFRPTDDGCLLNLEDDEVELSSGTVIQLAHAAVVDNEMREAWIAHFSDYKVTFLFSQMLNTLPELDLKQVEIEDKKGWLTDTFTLRGVLTKMGYQRAPAEDGGSFSHYYKYFSSLDMYVNIGFSGSYVPEENIPAVLFDVSFEKNQQNYWDRNNLALHDVPPILLAESYADYLKVAQACSGYDADWESKTPW